MICVVNTLAGGNNKCVHFRLLCTFSTLRILPMAHNAKTKQFSFWHLVALGTVSTGLLLSADFSVAQEKETKKQATAKDDKEAKKDDKDRRLKKAA